MKPAEKRQKKDEISSNGFLSLATDGTVAVSEGCPTAMIIVGFSEAGLFRAPFRNFIGLGVCVSVDKPA